MKNKNLLLPIRSLVKNISGKMKRIKSSIKSLVKNFPDKINRAKSSIGSLIKNVSERIKSMRLAIKASIMRSLLVRSVNNVIFYIASNPILSTIGVSVILYPFILGIVWLLGGSMMWLSIITVIYFGSVYWFAHFVKKYAKKFTVVELKKDQIALIYFGEEIKIYNGPFSGEKPSQVRIIQLPNGWGTEIKKYDKKEMEIEVEIDIERHLLNFGVVIHFFIKFEFLGPFQTADLEQFITRNDIDKSPFLFKSFVKEIFINSGSNFREMQKNAEGYTEKKITMPKLINEILLDVKFPRHLFPNILNTTIRIGRIEFQSELEM